MEWIILWIGATIIVGVLAPRRGRSGPGWVLLSFILSPLVCGLLLLVPPSKKMSERDQMLFDAMTNEQQRRVLEAREARHRASGGLTAPDGGPAWWHRVP
jgi:hypothetical protein